MRNFIFFFSFIICAQSALGHNGTEPVLLTDMLKIKTVGNINLTKDGTMAAFTVTSIEPDDQSKLDYKYQTQIFRVATSGNQAPIQLTMSKEGGSQPVWSPDGKKLAFTRAAGDRSQIFVLSMEGGEPMQLTSYKYGASNPVWSPDGKQILFLSGISIENILKDSSLNSTHAVPHWPSEKPGFENNNQWKWNQTKGNPNGSIAEIRTYLDSNVADKKAIVLNKLNFQSESGISAATSFNHFFIINAVKDAQPIEITKGFYSFSNASFTPDGKRIIFSGDVDSLESPERSLESEIYISNIDGTNFKKLLGKKGMSYGGASLSHSGKWLAFVYGPTESVSIPTLALMPLDGSESEIISIPFDRNKGSFTWDNDDQYLYFTAQSNGGNLLNRMNRVSKKIEALSGFEAGITSFDIANNKIVFSKTQVSNPSELFIADAALKNEKQVSNFNDWVKTKKLAFPEKNKFVNDKGMTVEYWVMKPANFEAGKKYPLLLEIHGGPSAMWGPGEASMWHEYQYFCSKGYGVVYSNPRGSGGYGVDFLRDNINDWGKGPTSDVLTSLDNTVAEGWVDTSKLMVTGGSYAGYLVAWIIAHDHRFKAACSQRGVYDLMTFFGEGNAWRLVPGYFGGYPWEPRVKEILVRESPITYVQNITTPYIIFHGGSDRRTGFVQGEMMYRSLKVLGRPVEYVVHPGGTHELTRSGDNRQRLDQMLRTYEFFERFIK